MTRSLRNAYHVLSGRLASWTGSSFIIEHDHIELSSSLKPRPSRAAASRTDRVRKSARQKA